MQTPAPAVVTLSPVLHAVTNDEILGRPNFIERARAVMRAMGSRGALQLRAARMAQHESGRFVEMALTLAEEQERTGAWLVVNDRVDIAVIVCARGVQLTARSLGVADAVQVVLEGSGNSGARSTPLVGASLHSLEEGIAARLAGASWGVVSDVLAPHESASNNEVDNREAAGESGPALLERLVRYSGIPIVAIGGIAPQHVAPLRRIGVHGIAAIRGIWDADDSERAISDYLSAYDSEVGR
ncbi:MAG TPA: thiamine phosphate synthase [Gemmatimonadaceae bacterium]